MPIQAYRPTADFVMISDPRIFHRDCPPGKTIKTCRDILHRIGFPTFEEAWFTFGQSCHSVLLSDGELPRLSTSGKGLSRELALASAYGEYLEHVQNAPHPKIPARYGLMPERFHAPDERKLKLGQLVADQGEVIENLCGREFAEEHADIEVTCLPFYNVAKDRVELLPSELIFHACTSNGWCAGNSAHEAMLQGLGELCERHAILTILRNPDLHLPTVPLKDLEHMHCYAVVQELRERGLRVMVKDCSLGGKLPVLGLLISDPVRSRYLARFASDPVLDVAFQRCLTESFQGVGDLGLDEELLPLDWCDSTLEGPGFLPHFSPFDYINKNNSPLVRPLLLNQGGQARQGQAFASKFNGNQDAFMRLLKSLQRQGRTLYVRDVSFLGFPAFHLHIPGMSQIDPRLCATMLTLRPALQRIKEVLLNLPMAAPARIKECAEALETIQDRHFYLWTKRGLTGALDIMDLRLKPDSACSRFFATEHLMAMLFHSAGEPDKALRHFERYLKQMSDANEKRDWPYLHGCLAYLRLKSDGLDNARLEASLRDNFGSALAATVQRDLGDREDLFSLFKLPQCGDCRVCPIQEECCYPTWCRRCDALRETMKANPRDQQSLRELFC